jgi:hypothetical protein
MEDEDTDFIDIAPVNKVFNLIVCWDRYGPDSEEFRQHQIKLNNLLWMNKFVCLNESWSTSSGLIALLLLLPS